MGTGTKTTAVTGNPLVMLTMHKDDDWCIDEERPRIAVDIMAASSIREGFEEGTALIDLNDSEILVSHTLDELFAIRQSIAHNPL